MIGFIRNSLLYYFEETFNIRRKPRILQLPITSKCNSRCLTCNIWKHHERKDIDASELKRVLSSPFFSKVVGVGINGGEPTLHNNFVDVVKSILTLPKLKNIFIISNCINGDKLLTYFQEIYPLCKEKGVKLHLQISIDGVGEIHNLVRGIKVSFDRSMSVFQELCKNKSKYLDEFDIGCTISKYNVDYIVQIQDYFSEYSVPVYYHLAVPNKRIHNFDDAPFSVLTDKHATQMAKEFFQMRSAKASDRLEKIRCYLIYLYLNGDINKRVFLCDYLYQDITINEKLDTYLCATASEKVGNLIEGIPSYKQYNSIVNDTKRHCDLCIHYANYPNLRGIYTYIRFKMKTFKWIIRYK